MINTVLMRGYNSGQLRLGLDLHGIALRFSPCRAMLGVDLDLWEDSNMLVSVSGVACL